MKKKENTNKSQSSSSKENKVINSVNNFIKENSIKLEEHYYSVIDNSKNQRVKNAYIYENIASYDYNAELLNVDVVILTANFFECEILNYNVYKDHNIKIKKLENGIDIFPENSFKRVDAFIMKINEYTVLHLNAPETGSNTPCGSSDLVRYISSNKFLYPSCIISFGICYGINLEKQSLCDTIIANKVYPWSVGIKVDNQKWYIKHDDYILNLQKNYSSLYKRIESVTSGKKNNAESINFENVIIGNMITSEVVVSNEKVKIKAIEKAYGCNIVGGEMEGYGLAKECIYYSDIPCLILKAICDWGVNKDIDKYLAEDLPNEARVDCKGKLQAYAAYCAYTVLRKLFYEKIFDKKNINKEIIDDIWQNYYTNGYIQDEFLKEHISKFLMKKLQVSKKSLIIHNLDDVVETVIKSYLLDTERMGITRDEGILGYVFK